MSAHLISGRLVGGSVAYTRRDPLTGTEMPAHLIGAGDADRLVAGAVDAMGPLAAMPLAARTAALRALADKLDAAGTELTPPLIREIGTPVDQAAKLQIGSAVAVLRAMADVADAHDFTEERPALRGGMVRIQKHPVGVVAGIVPWNVPLFLACVKLSAAIAAACPIILKPSPENAASMAVFARLLSELNLPDGAVQCATGDRDLGEALVAHAGVAKVSFTGSTAAGRAVVEACARRLARCTLELGGKSAAIILPDADLDAVRDQFFLATLQNNGQVCGAQSRVLIPERHAAKFTDWIAAVFDGLKVGDPNARGTQIGPLATFAQAERVRGYLDRARGDGAQIIASAPAPEAGAFTPPALLRAEPHQEIAREEIFGPVTTILTYRDPDHAVALANDSPYGLSGSIWSTDLDRAAALAARLRTGTVGINSKKILDFGAPFGGFRASGLGRELGPEGLDAYLESSAILIPNRADPAGTSAQTHNDQRFREDTHV